MAEPVTRRVGTPLDGAWTLQSQRLVAQRFDDDSRWSRLAQEAATGEDGSIRRLISDILPRVRNLVRYLVRRDHDVDDLSQDALVLLLEGIHTYRGEGAFLSWADRVVARSVFASRRSLARRAERPAESVDPADVSSPQPDGYMLRRQVAARLDALPLAQRDALVLHCVVGLRVADVAAEVGVPEETIRSRIRLGKDRLRQQLSDPLPPLPAVSGVRMMHSERHSGASLDVGCVLRRHGAGCGKNGVVDSAS